jgi:cyclomaltodextrinase / maltogenic alpha-amylase / neopullulanase
MPKLGNYKHFKGAEVEVIGVAKHSETLEEMVVYRHESELWVRPVKMFEEEVDVSGQLVPRFKFIN